MKRSACVLIVAVIGVLPTGCSQKSAATYSLPKPTSYGATIVESSGGKQVAEVGTPLPQPVVIRSTTSRATESPAH